MADLARMLVLGPGPKESPSSPPSVAILVRFHCVVPARTPAGRTPLATRNGFRFLLLCGCYAGSGRCGGVLRTSAHRAISMTGVNELCVAVMQVDEVGGGDLREMARFPGRDGGGRRP